MTIDHIGAFFIKENEMLRIIGRIAFPLYAYFIAQGYKYTSNLKHYAMNLLILAVIIHIPSLFGVGIGAYNVIFTLFFGLIAMILLDKPYSKEIKITGLLCICLLFFIFPFEYGFYGLVTVLMFHYFEKYHLLVAHMAINIIFVTALTPYQMHFTQVYAILSSVLILVAHRLPNIKINKTLYWLFYPVHLFLFYFIGTFV
jgi:hypothetical protein